MTTSPTLEEFLATAREEFSYLVTDYRYIEVPTNNDENVYLVKFENHPIRVSIEGINYGFGVQVMLTNITAGKNEVAKVPLWAVVELTNPNGIKAVSGQLQKLAVLSEALNVYGSDVLKGSLSVFPKAYELMVEVANRSVPTKRKLP